MRRDRYYSTRFQHLLNGRKAIGKRIFLFARMVILPGSSWLWNLVKVGFPIAAVITITKNSWRGAKRCWVSLESSGTHILCLDVCDKKCPLFVLYSCDECFVCIKHFSSKWYIFVSDLLVELFSSAVSNRRSRPEQGCPEMPNPSVSLSTPNLKMVTTDRKVVSLFTMMHIHTKLHQNPIRNWQSLLPLCGESIRRRSMGTLLNFNRRSHNGRCCFLRWE